LWGDENRGRLKQGKGLEILGGSKTSKKGKIPESQTKI